MVTDFHMIKLYTFFECFEKESSPVAEFVGILFMKFLYFCAFFWLALDSRLSWTRRAMMEDNKFGLTYRYPSEKLPLQEDDQIIIPAETVAVLTNFQLDAIRFLWSSVRDNRHCFFNDGRHMGKRISLVALIAALVDAPKEARILIACDKDEAIVSWIFKLNLFLKSSSTSFVFSVYSGRGGRQGSESLVQFVNFQHGNFNFNKTIQENRTTLLIVDMGSATARDLKWGLDASMGCCVIACSSDVQKANLLDGLFRSNGNKESSGQVQWKTLRRTNEEHLREFPWMDENQFKKKFEDWRAKRSAQEIFHNPHPKSAVFAPPLNPKSSRLEVDPEKKEEEDDKHEVIADNVPTTTLLTGPVGDLGLADKVFEESQEMSQLLFETDDEMTPIKQDIRPAVQPPSNHLLSSMYLRLSQSFATHTPKQRRITISSTVQDSPDLFASIINDDIDDDDDDDDDDNDTTNAFEKSTPLSESSQKLLEIESQSPIYSLVPLPEISPEKPELNESLVNKSDQMFEITSNEVFANRMKITSSQNHHEPMEEDEEEKLKFDTPENNIFNTPSRKGGKKSTPSPGSSGWLSKKGPRVKTPEKVLVKKRKSLLQFYSGKSASGSGSLDFSSLEDEATQRWNAC